MPIRKVHPDTAKAARRFARETLGLQDVKLRAPTAEEKKLRSLDQLDVNMVRDIVVAKDKKGDEYALLLDLDPTQTRNLNLESGLLTSFSLIPIIGAPVVAGFAIKDLIKGGRAIKKAKQAGNVADPADRAICRMGLKHFGLSGLSMLTQGISAGAHAVASSGEIAQTVSAALDLTDAGASEIKETAHSVLKGAGGVKAGLLGTEAVVIAADTVGAVDAENKKAGANRPLKALAAALQGLAGVHHHHERKPEDARVLVLRKKSAEGQVESRPALEPAKRVRKSSNPPTGPPSSL